MRSRSQSGFQSHCRYIVLKTGNCGEPLINLPIVNPTKSINNLHIHQTSALTIYIIKHEQATGA